MVLNSDSSQYAEDYEDIGHDIDAGAFPYDGMSYSGTISLGPYSVQIFSQLDLPDEPCAGDLSGDGNIDISDLLAVIAGWGTPKADVTGDNMTNVEDLLFVIGVFGPCP
mgnify:FL=1